MHRKRTSASLEEDAPIKEADISRGVLVLRKRDEKGALLASDKVGQIQTDSMGDEKFKSKIAKLPANRNL